jgi:hypothetical protein
LFKYFDPDLTTLDEVEKVITNAGWTKGWHEDWTYYVDEHSQVDRVYIFADGNCLVWDIWDIKNNPDIEASNSISLH